MQKAADDKSSCLTPSKADVLATTFLQAPVTPVSAAPLPSTFYPPSAPLTSHSNPNTPVNQRAQRHANQPKFSTPQPGRHQSQSQGWHQPGHQPPNVSFFTINNGSLFIGL